MERQSFYEDNYEYNHYCPHDCEVDKCQICVDQGSLVEKVICSKNILSTAELAWPFALEAGGPGSTLYDLVASLGFSSGLQVNVTPNYAGIQQEATPFKDSVMIFGTLPVVVNITSTATPLPAGLPINFTARIFFEGIVDCPGACPGDRVMVSNPVIEKTLNQPLLGSGPNSGLVVNFLLFKAVLNTHVTLVRKGIEKNGCFYDLDPRRCETNREPQPINTPFEIVPNTSPLVTPTPPTPPTT